MKIRRILGWTALAIPLALLAILGIAYWRSDNACGDPGRVSPRVPVKAIIYCDYGTPDVLKLVDIEKPVPADDQLLVRVHAAATNPLDWHYIRGTPYIMRLETGLRRPKELRLGVDFAGTVEATGKSVTRFKPGDEVFGGRTGAFGEYVVVREQGAIAPKPSNLSFEQAAGVGIAAVTALQALHKAGVGPESRVLINGASGGVGTFAVQIAKSMGAHVTGVSSTRNIELVRSLGADDVIDYTREDYTKNDRRFDVIIDNVGNHGFLANRRALERDGVFVLIGGGGPENGQWFGPVLGFAKGPLLGTFVSQDMGVLLASLSAEDLLELSQLMQTGRVTPVIDRRYTLSEVPDAIRYLETGRARGKVIITLAETSSGD
jgi:NADPH:quinone reductase-like Zn-dependent oxidoreductase